MTNTESQIDLATLSKFQRILLIADGTLTKILETYLDEEIHVVKLSEKIILRTEALETLEIDVGQQVLEREVLLHGKISQRHWLYAKSTIVLDRLSEEFKDQLINSQRPIGKLWLEYKTETFKEMLASAREIAGDLSEYFMMKRDDKLISRTYRVFSDRQAVMMITEKFPDCYFC